MNTPLHHHIVALGLAALVTVGVLEGLSAAADHAVARPAPGAWAANSPSPVAAAQPQA